MFCKECGNELRENAKFCDKCGYCLEEKPKESVSCDAVTADINAEPKAPPTVEVESATPTTPAKAKKRNGCAGCLVAIICVAAISAGAIYAATRLPSASPSADYRLTRAAQATEEQGEAIKTILEQCGINKVSNAEHDELLDHDGLKGYRITANGVKNVIVYMNEENQIVTVKHGDIVMCDNGEVVDNINNYILSDKEESDMLIKSEEIIKQFLTSPATAKFPLINNWKFGRDAEKMVAQSYVDSQNAFGATVRSEFWVTFTPDGMSVTSVIIDGKEYYK